MINWPTSETVEVEEDKYGVLSCMDADHDIIIAVDLRKHKAVFELLKTTFCEEHANCNTVKAFVTPYNDRIY